MLKFVKCSKFDWRNVLYSFQDIEFRIETFFLDFEMLTLRRIILAPKESEVPCNRIVISYSDTLVVAQCLTTALTL
jgi:hypothetical protein